MVRKAIVTGFEVWGISSGVIALARAGILDGRVAAAHWEDAPYIRENHPEIRLSDRIYEAGTQISTCAGGAAASDLALSRVVEVLGLDAARKVLALLNIEHQRDARVEQFGSAAILYSSQNNHVSNATALMRRNAHRRLSVAAIAEAVGVSQKQLERLFASEFSVTPKTAYERICLEYARRDVLIGRKSINQVSMEFHYSSSEFSAKYRNAFGVTPLQDRKSALGHQEPSKD